MNYVVPMMMKNVIIIIMMSLQYMYDIVERKMNCVVPMMIQI